MIEILALIVLTSRIGKMVEAKGHRSGTYKFYMVALWFGGEILGALFGGAISGLSGSRGSEMQCIIYSAGLLGAVLGALIAYKIAKDVQPVPGYPLRLMGSIGTTGSATRLAELKKMLDSGLISFQEYETKKAELLKQM